MDLLNRLLQPGKSILLKYTGTGVKGSVHTYIIRSANEEQLALLVKESNSLISYLHPGTKVKLIGRDEDEGHEYRLLSELIEIKQGELPLVIVKRPREVDHSTRRSSLRLDVSLPFSYYDDLKEKMGEIRNLSINGLLALVKLSPSLKLNNTLTGKITLPTVKKPLLIIGKITRVQKEDENHAWVALDFQTASEDVKNKISFYLVQRQRHLINMRRKNTSSINQIAEN
ncbi:MAG: PilZ domain-containing protein [Firmicutes bacterium]|nr:PilZ domain-containing protein [Bacillota bacterium]